MIGANCADFQTLNDAQKALVYGLPKGLSLAERLPIFCKIFSVPWDAFQSENGPSRDALEHWREGKLPNDTMLDKLEASSKDVLVNRKDFRAPTASRAAKWLARGSPPLAVAQEKRPRDSQGIAGPSHAQDSSLTVASPTRLEEWVTGLESLEVNFLAKIKESSDPHFVMRAIRRLFNKSNALLNSMILTPGPEFNPQQRPAAIETTYDLTESADYALRLAYRSCRYANTQASIMRDCDEVSTLGAALRDAVNWAFSEDSEVLEPPEPHPPAPQLSLQQPSGLAERLKVRFREALDEEMGIEK